MAELQTDEEKVEALKAWWRENGVAVIAGVVLGLLAVFGWRAWVAHQERVGQNAALAFEQLLERVERDAIDPEVETSARALLDQYGGTPYAMFAQLALAKARLAQRDLAGTAAALRAASAAAPHPALAEIAALRLARVLLAQGEYEAARTLITQHENTGAFGAEFAALRGDLAAATGRIAEARAAWQTALAAGARADRLLEYKLRDLPVENAAGSGG